MAKVKLEQKFHDIREVITPGWKIDKIKLKYILRKKEEIQKITDLIEIDTRVTKRYESNYFESCKMNYVLSINKKGTNIANIYIGIGSNQNVSFDEQNKTLILEYNPNKVDAFKEIEYIQDLIFIDIHRREIMSIDMAYDMFIPIAELQYEKRRINEYECKIGHERIETIYLRKMGNNGAVRIYDKTLEMNGGNEETEEETGEVKKCKYFGDCTRYEIRIKPGKYKKEFNFLSPWLLEEFAKLHKLSLKEESQEDKILKEIETRKGADFNNLLLIHLGYIDRVHKNKRKEYKELYQEIKKMALVTTKTTNIFIDFNTDKMLKPINDYLKYITTDKNNQILLHNILLKN